LTESLNARRDALRLTPLHYVGLFAALLQIASKRRKSAEARKSVKKSAQREGVKNFDKPKFSPRADDFSFCRAGAAFCHFLTGQKV
jgi:uncharacterized protein (DUF2342 family)